MKKRYDPMIWYADKGDIVWYINSRGSIVKAKISSRNVWEEGQENDPNFLKFYNIKPDNIWWWHIVWDKITLFVWRRLYRDKVRGTAWSPNWRWPGHSVALGEDIFLFYGEAVIELEETKI